VTFDEEVDEVTGQSRMVVKDSPDEKKQPRLDIRSGTKLLKTYQMPGACKPDGQRRRRS
jgi:DNA-directed RNA polymerase subunit beta'